MARERGVCTPLLQLACSEASCCRRSFSCHRQAQGAAAIHTAMADEDGAEGGDTYTAAGAWVAPSPADVSAGASFLLHQVSIA